MKDFLKFTLATITGIIVSSIILFFISILVFFSIVSSSDSETQVRKNSIMMLDLNGMLAERTQENPFDFLLGDEYNTYGLDDILSSIKKAKENADIKGIYIQACSLGGASFASLEEIRNSLKDFKESGKFIVAYGDTYTQSLYYLSSIADKVLLNPKGAVEWKGLAASPMFFKDLLGKIGVEMQIFKVGTYKSAVEPFISTEMSPANREQVNAYLASIWKQIMGDVATSRKISVDSLNAAANSMLMFYPAERCVKAGLADTLIYKNDVRNYLKTMAGIEENDKMPVLSLKNMVNIKKNVPKDKSGNVIAIYYAYGEIDGGSSSTLTGEEGINSEKVIKDLRKLKDDKDVKAVVLRVNSPGGSAYGSEQIWYAVSELKKKKPVIVSMGDYAASGGYYISCNADTIVAEPTTLTGSIGIFGMFPNAKGLADKIGISFDVVKTNRYSDFGMITRPMNEGEKGLLQMYINQGYDTFLARCSEGRGISKEELDKIAQGRVWTGSKAKELGLVDELGGIDRALEIAIAKAGTDTYTIMSYPKKENFLESFMNSNPGNYIKAHLLNSKVGEMYKQFSILDNFDRCDRLQARVPFELNIQ
ncbi:signal peptide peptidase SppA [Bacteroides helcogenes]|uniref:Signal peptide peptidase A n=1 Tax=Bacteroides helcogenes (strain ATCC 35417 / DSM 20613 / JCM 6297 / CCUG 15421 / P 36-108) TaxID=693979 RepID=E6SRK9_BACT6|nr:signal peptide peptidase SppA [Bacteroides helcogenes]ADV45099.1 signal peptide peptidase A [Bacteroides helcogenes P 36-108]MDY5238659.1 signal peptide peptidase SppA [Bacteroides helcogenes]